MDRGVWWATIHGITKSQTQLSSFHFHSPLPVLRGLHPLLHSSSKVSTPPCPWWKEVINPSFQENLQLLKNNKASRFSFSLFVFKALLGLRAESSNLYLKPAGSVLRRTCLMFRPISIQVNLVLLMSVKSDFIAESAPRTLSLIKGERSGTTNLVSLKGMYFHAH